jgi:hypothetical protein
MENLLFTTRSLWTMLHGIVLGGSAMMAVAAALFALHAMRTARGSEADLERPSRHLRWLTIFTAALLWATVLSGTYVVFPPYRATPPDGATDLARYPRSLIQSDPDSAWLHSFAMEVKEHTPWIAVMLSTAVACIAVRYRTRLLTDPELNGLARTFLAVCIAVVAFASILGVFVNKVAPLE